MNVINIGASDDRLRDTDANVHSGKADKPVFIESLGIEPVIAAFRRSPHSREYAAVTRAWANALPMLSCAADPEVHSRGASFGVGSIGLKSGCAEDGQDHIRSGHRQGNNGPFIGRYGGFRRGKRTGAIHGHGPYSMNAPAGPP